FLGLGTLFLPYLNKIIIFIKRVELMNKSFRSKNILLVLILALLVFVGGKIYFSNPDNLERLEVGNNPQVIMSIQEINN
ncbi:hypothetical protein, partial [Clostridium perfringens]